MIQELMQICPKTLQVSIQDATNLPYPNASFDVVLIANALHIMPQPDLALHEIHRILKPNGILLAPTFVYEGTYNKLRLRMMKLLGFPSCSEWTLQDLTQFVEQAHFKTIESTLIEANPLPVAFLALYKQ